MKKTAFLFGAGISIPAELPSTTDITEFLLNSKNIFRHSDETYFIKQANSPIPHDEVKYVLRNQIFLKRLKIEAELFYLNWTNKIVNYEDLYYLATQISDCETGEFDNPAIQPFIDKIYPDIKHLLKETRPINTEDWPISKLADETTNYIRDVVWGLLYKSPKRADYLTFLIEIIKNEKIENIDIYTLNHDILLEQILSTNGIDKICDGFGDYKNEVKYWTPILFESSKDKVKLLKLHGSINWFRFRKDDGDWRDDQIGITKSHDFWHTRDQYNNPQFPPDGRPLFLAGTYNKMMQYTSGIYMDIHCLFYKRLSNFEQLIISGYSFGDKGINGRIIEWLYSKTTDNRIVIVDPNPDRLKKIARGSISNKWDLWRQEGLLKIIPKAIENVEYKDLFE